MQTQTPSIHLLLAKKSSNTETRETLLQAQIQIMSIEKAIILNSEGGWWGESAQIIISSLQTVKFRDLCL